MNAFNILFASIALLAAGYMGYEWRDYQVKHDLCQGLATVGAQFGGSIQPGSPCASYL